MVPAMGVPSVLSRSLRGAMREAAMVACLSICTPLSKGAALLWCPGVLCKHPRVRPVLAQEGGDRAQVLKERAVEDMTKMAWNLLGPRWRKIHLPEDPEPQDPFAATRQLVHTHGASTAPRPRRAKMWAVPRFLEIPSPSPE